MQFNNLLILAIVVCNGMHPARADATAVMGSNPIRKVVTLLENMAKKVKVEGKEEKELHEAFMCTCRKGIADLEKTIAASTDKVAVLKTHVKQIKSSQAKLKEDLANHKSSLAEAIQSLADATGVRTKEEKAFSADSTEKSQFIDSITKALPGLEKGMTGASFLQAEAALALKMRNAAASDSVLTDNDREAVLNFLSHGQSADQNGAGAGEIVGILKNMNDDYKKDLAAITATETEAVATFEILKEAKTKETKSLKKTIQKKTQRAGEVAVDLVQKEIDLKDTEKMLAADQELLKNLSDECTAAPIEFANRKKLRAEELLAIGETVKILTDDDALDVFKASLPASQDSKGSAFLQLSTRGSTIQRRLMDARAAAAVLKNQPSDRSGLRFLELALLGKKVDFSNVDKLIDDMIKLCAKENVDDASKKKYCKAALQKAEAKGKDIGRDVKEQTNAQEDRTDKLATLAAEIESTKSEIVALDTLLKDAKKERKAQNAEFQGEVSGKTAAKEILEMAKKKMSEFYHPKAASLAEQAHRTGKASEFDQLPNSQGELDKDPMPTKDLFKALDKREVSFIQTATSNNRKVNDMLNQLINEASNEIAVAKQDEEATQAAYEKVVSDSGKKRKTYVENLASKENAKADSEQAKTLEDEALTNSKKNQMANKLDQKNLHDDCDWLMSNFDLRRTARTDEVDSLKKAKAVLHGADSGLLQKHTFLAK